ncbi:Ribonuclease H-like superfamily [Arabidopsis suecica]|uniref:Ribonuclease H-like superfamily n=1 Tax=Arabidopsis suecica TaxID=45249 RepID=A0A8T2BS25_ARASU|nr:Ribonuclease H-like superfamily [Arabidopsis suecica]
MGLDSEEEADLVVIKDEKAEANTVCLHSFSDLTYVSPVVFLYLLKECYKHGSLKATKKFQALQYRVHQVLANKPQPGPATFIIKCLTVLPMFGVYGEGFSHLVISALRRFFKSVSEPTSEEDMSSARKLAAQFFLATVGGSLTYDEKVMLHTLKVFDVGLTSIDEALSISEVWQGYGFTCGTAFLEQYISDLIKSKSFMTAVTLLEHFSFRFPGETFLRQMVEDKDFQAAERWATFMGRPSLCILVQEYGSRNMLKQAYNVINKNYLQQDFPELYHKCKESALKVLAEKACWDVAENKTRGDRQLLKYLVYLAMEAGYLEKVDELCDRYSLQGLRKAQEAEVAFVQKSFLRLNDLAVEDVIWVDEVNELRKATSFLEGSRVVGIDCEWKPNYIKGSKQNKVSIMQIGSDTKIFILDLIKLYNDASEILDNCLSQILQSKSTLKLGYNFQCDVKQLALSYGDLKCFERYDMLLDIQNVFKEPFGGLAGLTKKILGVSLNKTRRNSDWEQRPLTQNQLEYAALDAAVLIHIFRHVRDHPPHDSSSETVQWKSHIVSHMESPKKLKKKPKCHSTQTSASTFNKPSDN